jgi:uncharacterized protein YeaO (DUF488 family)
MPRSVFVKRVYDEPSPRDGLRILVDRLWPRGLSREAARVDRWMKELAPSTELRKWFNHDVDRWREFQERYATELDRNADLVGELIALLEKRRVTLLYGARDERHNQAIALQAYLRGYEADLKTRP